MENDLIARLKEILTDKNYRDIPLDFVVDHVREAIKGRAIKAFHVNQHIPNGYEEQGAFNLLIVTAGNHLFDCVVGEEYFRYDSVASQAIDKFQVIDGQWESKETNKTEEFLSLRLSHGDESHIALAMDTAERHSLTALSDTILAIRNPEK